MRKLTTALLCLIVVLASLPVGALPVAAETEAGPDLIISEVHYDPADKTAGLEFVEIYNPTASALDLTGWSLGAGVDFVFPRGAGIQAGGYLAVAQNPGNVRARYGGTTLGPLLGKLATEGEAVELRDRSGRTVDRVEYALGFPWPLAGGPADTSIGLINMQLDNSQPAAWRSGWPTPGRANSNSTDNPPPAIDLVEHTPQSPHAGSDIVIKAHVTDADGVASVQALVQVVTPGSYLRIVDGPYSTRWSPLPMQHIGGDVYTAQLPANVRRNRTLIRYRVEATDRGGRKVTVPYADDTQPNFAMFIYNGLPAWSGAVAPNPMGEGGSGRRDYDFNQMRQIPVYHLLADLYDVEDAQFIPNSPMRSGYMGSDFPWYGTLVYNGVVYDHIRFRARGGGYRYSVGKNHWKFNFNRGHGFQAYDDYGNPHPTKWDKLNLGAIIQHAKRRYRGEQGLFETLSYQLFDLAGVPASETNFIHFRVIDEAEEVTSNQYRGDFWGLYLAIENMDGRFLDANDLPDSNLYDMHDWTGDLDNQGEQGVGDKSDLNNFMWMYINGNPNESWWRQNFDLAGYYSFRAILEAIHHYDVDQGKNYYFLNNHELGKWQMLPWDLDLTWAETMFGEGNEPLRDRILAKPAFNLEYQNRLREIRDLLFNPDQIFPMVDAAADVVDSPVGGLSMVDADRAMWDWNPILNSRYISTDRAVQGRYYAISPTYDFRGMAHLMKEYVNRRTAWIDQTLLTDRDHPNTPNIAYSGPGGYPADKLSFQSSAFGDPQGASTFAAMQWRAAEVAWPGMAGYQNGTRNRYEMEATWTSPELTSYAAGVTIPNGACRPGRTCRVRVRMKDNTGRWSHWSAPVQFVAGAPALGATRDLRVTEIMYHPAPSDTLPNEEMEFIELANVGASPVDLSNMRFAEGIDYTFPAGSSLAPGAHVVLAGNERYFRARYGFAPFGIFDRGLADGGERLTLVDAYGATVLSVSYSDADGWPDGADGNGPSLVALAPLAGADPNSPDSWRMSTGAGGSPGADDPLPVLISEIAVDPASGTVSTVEFVNNALVDADVSGWLLSTSQSVLPARWSDVPAGQRIPAGSVVPAGGYLAVTLDPNAAPLRVNADGGTLGLFSAAPGGLLSGYADSATFPLPPAGGTVGRYVSSDGVEHYVAQTTPTLSGPNAGPMAGPVVISRVMLRPGDGVQWIELANISAEPVPLYDPSNLRRTWVVGGVPFRLAAGTTLAPGARLIVAGAEPDAFCQRNTLPAGMRIVGPLARPLMEQDLNLTLLQPVAWGGGWSYAVVDSVRYRPAAGWPQLGGGATGLTRGELSGFGSEPASWQAAVLQPGDAGQAPADGIQVCSFDVFVNASRQVEVRWATSPAGAADAFRLLRSPLDDPSQVEIVTGDGAAAGDPAATPGLFARVDPTADPGKEYFYRLELVESDGATREIAATTMRASFFGGYAPAVFR